MPCTPVVEDKFGPIVSDACLNGFDFTLLFEEKILTFLPLLVASLWAILRIVVLRHKAAIVFPSFLLPTKLLCYATYEGLQIALLALWAPNGVPRTRFTLVCISFSIVIHAFLPVVSYLEHTRSVRPSTMLVLHLGITSILDLARTRTLFFTSQGETIARVNLTSLLVKLLILGFELVEKRGMLRPESKTASLEATSSTLSRALFLWLNAVFIKGFRSLLTINTLLPLDDEILAASEPSAITTKWNNLRQQKEETPNDDDLLWVFAQHFKWAALAGVFPRLAYAGFAFAQPYLVQSVLDFTAASQGLESNTTTAYALIGAYAIVYIGISLSYSVYQHKTYRLLTMVRGSLVSMIFDKTLRAETSTYNNAEAVTLMSADIDRITGSMHIIHELYASVIEAGIALWFLYDFLGIAMVPPLAWMGICVAIGIPIAKASGNAQIPWLEAIEDRLASTAKALSAMKAIKMTGLMEHVHSLIAASRITEIRASRRHRVLNIFVFVSSFASLAMAPVLGFLTYILLAKSSDPQRTLTAGVAFGALSLFELLQQPVQYAVDGMEDFQTLVNSFRRIQEYLVSRDREDYRTLLPERYTPPHPEKANLDGVESMNAFDAEDITVCYENDGKSILKDLTFRIPRGQTTIVYGQIGCGKTTLLKLLLGEMPVFSGSLKITDSRVSYCSQKAWCSWGTIRSNIIGKSIWDENWYQQVLSACALSHDLAQLPEGEQTLIGNRGSSLSGGQQSRIALARAIYSRRPVMLLDGVLEGLDRATEHHIIEAVFGTAGILARLNATVVLATTSTDHLKLGDHIIPLSTDGGILKQDAQITVKSSNSLDTISEEEEKDTPHVETLPGPTTTTHEKFSDSADDDDDDEQQLHRLLDDFEKDGNARKTGDWQVYLYYARIAGWPLITLYLLACAVLVFGLTFPSLWLQWWTNANAKHPNERIPYWIGVFAGLGFLALVGCAIADSVFNLLLLPKTSKRFHELLLDTTMHASTNYLTSTDAGTTLNRFSQDLELIDNDLPQAINQAIFQFMSTIVTAALVFSGSGYIAAAIPILIVVIILISLFYLRTSRQMRLLDIEAKAPLFSHFLESIHGIESIRAYGWTAEYTERNLKALNNSQRPCYLLFCLQRWLTLVLDLLNAGVAITLVAIATNIHNGSTEFLGVALFNIVIFSSTVQSLVTEWTQVEAALGAINRIRAYEQNVQNENLPGEKGSLSNEWPTQGRIVFENVQASYDSLTNPILRNINLVIDSGMKVAICGRTGSGKSSLTGTLLRTVDIDHGRISIDNVDMTTIPREEVRRRLNTLPQEPFFLRGTVRENLDPYHSVSEEQRLIHILQKLHLWEKAIDEHGGLDADMEDVPLSHGQRQLFCLGRCLVKGGNLVILDEVTSGVDSTTASLMQGVIREEFVGRTIVAVAHKLHEVLDFDRVVVLNRGQIVEVGCPRGLLRETGSAFHALYEAK